MNHTCDVNFGSLQSIGRHRHNPVGTCKAEGGKDTCVQVKMGVVRREYKLL